MRQQARHNSFVATYRLQRNSKTNVLSDMPSDSKKYKDLRSEKHTYKLAIVSKRIEKSLYLIPADCKSAGTIALLLNTQHTGGYICS